MSRHTMRDARYRNVWRATREEPPFLLLFSFAESPTRRNQRVDGLGRDNNDNDDDDDDDDDDEDLLTWQTCFDESR